MLVSDKAVYALDAEVIRKDWPGQVIAGRFPLLEWLGGSERGGVFLTELQGPGSQKAAIKLIPADARAEARIAVWALTAPLSHPHLMHLLHTGRCEIDSVPLLYAVTEHAEQDLSQVLPDRPLTPTEAREMLGPILDALSYLHENGFVHGHLKPSNIMVVDDQLRLSSDRLYVISDPGRHLASPGAYEDREGATRTISPAADIWSLGVVMVEALTQHPPVWDRSRHGDPIVPQSLPQPFAGIARECLRADPERRCTIGDVKARIEPPPPLPPPQQIQPRKPVSAKLPVMPIVVAFLALIAIIAVLQLRFRRPETPAPAPSATAEAAPATTVPQPQEPARVVAAAQPQATVPDAQSFSEPAVKDPATEQVPSSLPPAPETKSVNGPAAKGAVNERVMPDITPRANASIHGKFGVVTRVTVDADGNVADATLDSPGPSRYFADLALKASQKWKFTPPQVGGQAVSSVWVLQFQFRRDAIDATPVEVSP